MFCHSFLLDYRAYLKDLQEASQAGFDSLHDKAKQLQCKIPSFTSPKKVNFVQGIDKESQERIPTGSLEGRYFALSTHGDGNCLFRAASILAFGDENKHFEMRVRTLVELACNKSYYSKFPKIESGDVQAQEAHETQFQVEVQNTCKESSWASDCHLRALPTLFGRSIKIVFAEGIEYDQRYFIDLKDVLRPRGFYSMLEPLVIMMTNATKEEGPNHFVPLVPAGEYRSSEKGRLKILPIVFIKCLFFIRERSFCLAVIFRTNLFFRQIVIFVNLDKLMFFFCDPTTIIIYLPF